MVVYAPDSKKSLEMYEELISCVVKELHDGRKGGAKDFSSHKWLQWRIGSDVYRWEREHGPFCLQGYDKEPGSFKKMWYGIMKESHCEVSSTWYGESGGCYTQALKVKVSKEKFRSWITLSDLWEETTKPTSTTQEVFPKRNEEWMGWKPTTKKTIIELKKCETAGQYVRRSRNCLKEHREHDYTVLRTKAQREKETNSSSENVRVREEAAAESAHKAGKERQSWGHGELQLRAKEEKGQQQNCTQRVIIPKTEAWKKELERHCEEVCIGLRQRSMETHRFCHIWRVRSCPMWRKNG